MTIQTIKSVTHAGFLDDDGKDIAANVTYDPTSSGLVATDVQAAIDEIAASAGSDDQTAAEVPFTPAAGIAATDVQAAIVEDAGDLAAHLADTSDAHDASAISIVDAGGYYTGTDVEAALQELGTGVVAAAVIYAPVMATSPNIVTTDGSAVWLPLVDADGEPILATVP